MNSVGAEADGVNAYTQLCDILHGQASTMGDALASNTGDCADPDPDGVILDCIREGRTIGPQSVGEHVETLAALGYSIETTADALGKPVEEVQTIAVRRLERLCCLLEQHKGTSGTQQGGPGR